MQEWTTFCHSRPDFVVISHDDYREISTWQHVERRRKFCVTLYSHSSRHGLWEARKSFYATLANAEKEARKVAIEADRPAHKQEGSKAEFDRYSAGDR
jgi:hypothetical protein